ncbi:MAG: cytochrome C oxidase subunit IV family protein [Chloroflexi bacterium]|nr:cytochrome C oxidase subunit IV family protein [Chloroflexota bacterium]
MSRRVETRETAIAPKTLLVVGAVLLVLTLTTVALSEVPLGVWQTPVALTIAVVKAALIGVFFMELKGGPPLQRVVVFFGLLWLSVLILGTLDDVLTRGWLPVPGK